MSEAKIKVRAAALALGQFTVAQVQRTTGLNPSSIQTELQRMKQDGLLAVVDDAPDGRRRVGAPKTYEVVAEPSALQQLVASIEAFSPTSAIPERPTSREYEAAQALLDRALVATPDRRGDLLRDAEERLEAAEEAELAPLAPKVVQAYLRFERARLYFLREEYVRAEHELNEVYGVFAEAEPRMAQLVNEFQLTLATARDATAPSERSRNVLKTSAERWQALHKEVGDLTADVEPPSAEVRGFRRRGVAEKTRIARRRTVRPPMGGRTAVQPASRAVRPPVPVGDRVVVQPVSREETTQFGFVFPDTATEKPQRGTVVAVGQGRKSDDGDRIAMDVHVGDLVLFAKYAGTAFKYKDEDEDEEYLILSEKDILAKIQD
jgi:chaperonin GroES